MTMTTNVLQVAKKYLYKKAQPMRMPRTDRLTFNKLADQWEANTQYLSNFDQKIKCPKYQKILRMGKDAIPLILDRLRSQGGHWFHALSTITHENPVDPKDLGNIVIMRESWLEWGKKNEYTT